jgi:hypothetical protein
VGLSARQVEKWRGVLSLVSLHQRTYYEALVRSLGPRGRAIPTCTHTPRRSLAGPYSRDPSIVKYGLRLSFIPEASAVLAGLATPSTASLPRGFPPFFYQASARPGPPALFTLAAAETRSPVVTPIHEPPSAAIAALQTVELTLEENRLP